MKQMLIFEPSKHACVWELYVDGAARNNPGPAGAGVYLLKDGLPVVKEGFFLGSKTNNQAEYLALLLGLLYVKSHIGPHDKLVIKSDSELLVRQLSGIYSVKNKDLVRLHKHGKELLSGISYTIQHIPRAENKIADKLANQGIDKKIPIPQEFLTLWHRYEQSH
jgi:ribonuclease HI